MSGHFSVKNFEHFQHYKDRSPPWIKLYNELLDDYEFGRLPDASKAHLLAIWLLASRYDNKIPHDEAWVSRRINATTPVDLELLEKHGFILPNQECSNSLSNCKQLAMPEREKEGQVETEKRQTAFDDFFKAYPKKEKEKAARTEFDGALTKVDADAIVSGARRYASKIKREQIEPRFVALPQTWLAEERWREGAANGNGHAHISPEEIEGQNRLRLAAGIPPMEFD